jgi:hypothetical protein
MPALTSPCQRKGGDIFTWEDVKSVYKTDDELAVLYTMGEDRSAAVKITSGLNFRIQNYVESCVSQSWKEEEEGWKTES